MLSSDSIMRPPCTVNAAILCLLTSIGEKVGMVHAATLQRPPALLRRKNRIRTIHGTLAIEGNTLDVDRVTAMLDGKRVLAKASELAEVTNAIAVYDALEEFDPFKPTHFRKAHGVLMKGLVKDAGAYRKKAVGIVRGKQLTHLAPPAHLVPTQVDALLKYLASDPLPLLIKSCVVHYEIEFIHPFSDGNGRMGRLWQTCALMHYAPVFAYLPVEAMVRDQQQGYYFALAKADKTGDAAPFVEFMLTLIDRALAELLQERHAPLDATTRLQHFLATHGSEPFDRKTYLRHHPTLSMATASRDLRLAVLERMVVKKGDGRTTTYRSRGR